MRTTTVKIECTRSLLGKKNYVPIADQNVSKLKQATSQCAAPFNWTYRNLRSTDGIDDIGAALGATLPGIAAPALTIGIISGLTPFVCTGAAGAISDSLEQFQKTYPKTVDNTLNYHRQLIEASEKNASPTELAHRLEEYRQARKQQQIKKMERNFSLANASAMTGMSAGMVTSTINSVLDASAISTGNLAIETASSITATVTSGIFLAAQAGMAIYGTSRAITGKMHDHQLKRDQDALQSLPRQGTHTSPEYYADRARQSAYEVLQRERYYNKHHSISAGAILAVGQATMLASTAATMSGIAAPISMGMAFSTGIPLTLAGSAQRIIYEKREKKMQGEGHSHSAQKCIETDPIDIAIQQIFSQDQDNMAQVLKDKVNQVYQKYMQYQTGLAEMKLFSLRQTALQQKRLPDAPEKRRQQLIEMLQASGKHLSQSTTLVDSDLKASREILEQYDLFAFVGTRLALQANLLEEVRQSIAVQQLQPDPKLYKTVLNETIKKLNQYADKYANIAYFLQAEPGLAYKEISLEDIEKFAETNDIVKDVYQKQLTRTLIEQAKCDLKFLRNTAKDELIQLAHIQKNANA